MKVVTVKSEGHPITWESLLAVIGAGVLFALLVGGVIFWANYLWPGV